MKVLALVTTTAIMMGGLMMNVFGYPAQYTGDVSTPEKRAALTKAGVENQVNLYLDGGHGYGRRILGHATDIWSHYAAFWLAKFLK